MKTTRPRAAAAQDAVLTTITVGGTPGTFRIYAGAIPADLTVTPTGALLASANMGPGGAVNPFTATSSSTLVSSGFALPWSGSIVASGTATYWRVYDGAGTPVLQGSIGVAGSGAELILTSVTFTAGGTFTVSSFQSSIGGIT